MHTHCIAHFTSLRGTALHYLAGKNFGFLQLFCLFLFFWCFLLPRHFFAHTFKQDGEMQKKFAEFIFFPTFKKRLHFYLFSFCCCCWSRCCCWGDIFFMNFVSLHFIHSNFRYRFSAAENDRTDTNKHSRKETNNKTSANILLNTSCCCYYLLCSIIWRFFFFEWFFAYLLSIYNIAVVVVVVSCISISINQSILFCL